jgi:hypothetical protein
MTTQRMNWPLNRRGLLTHVHRPVRRPALVTSLEAAAGAPDPERPLTSGRL